MKAMKTLLISAYLIMLTQGAYVVRTFADAAGYEDACARQHQVPTRSSLIDYMRKVFLHDDDLAHWCVVRCILLQSDLLQEDPDGTTFAVANIHKQMQYSNAIFEDPDDIRSETERCLQAPLYVPDSGGSDCLRAYAFFSCIQSTEYDLF